MWMVSLVKWSIYTLVAGCLIVITLHKRVPKILIWFSNVLNREEFKTDVPSMIISSSSGIGYGEVVPSIG